MDSAPTMPTSMTFALSILTFGRGAKRKLMRRPKGSLPKKKRGD